MRYLHTMVRVRDLNESLDFYCNKLGLVESNRMESETGRFTLVYLHAPQDADQAKKTHAPLIELTYNWDTDDCMDAGGRAMHGAIAGDYRGGRNFGHLAFEVDNIYETCRKLMDAGVLINRPPRDGHMAFIRSPDKISIELLQKGHALAPAEPWHSMENTGTW
ncbi:MAG: VOC family protein [Methylobacter sp.]